MTDCPWLIRNISRQQQHHGSIARGSKLLTGWVLCQERRSASATPGQLAISYVKNMTICRIFLRRPVNDAVMTTVDRGNPVVSLRQADGTRGLQQRDRQKNLGQTRRLVLTSLRDGVQGLAERRLRRHKIVEI
jgi:hypothetical protein